jgi:hypothetical protein
MESDPAITSDRPLLCLALALPIPAAVAWGMLAAAPGPSTVAANRALLSLVLAAGAVFAWREHSSARLRSLLVSGTACHVYFVAALALFGVHLALVLSTPFRVEGWVYDFRFYSLMLVGGVGLVHGILGVASTPGIVRGERPAVGRGLRAALWLLAVNAPLIPVMDFAAAFAVGALSVLGLLSMTRSEFAMAND